ncbi:hypothetical protein [Mammaliicoccus sciuri]|uniref:hypothetical protein n=1 Tax=Mammaliicoccus sciuri TaxID=1296 RepID=UPI003F558A49
MNSINEYLQHLKLQLEKPIYIMDYDERYIILLDTEDNIKNFNTTKKFVDQKILSEFRFYYNTPDEFWKIYQGIHLRSELMKEQIRLGKLKNPPISEEIKSISSKDELIEYLLKERYESESAFIYENSRDDELDEAILNAEQEKLKRLADEFM